MKQIFPLAAMFCTICSAQASYTIPVTVDQLIPDGDKSGLKSTVTVSGKSGLVGNLEVSLVIEGSSNGDLYAYLQKDAGFTVLLNQVGRTVGNDLGFADPGFNVTFSDSATLDIHNFNGSKSLVSGTFLPDGRNEFPATDKTLRTTFLSSFKNVDPNGNWLLFVADVNGGDVHTLKSWSLTVAVPVPEPGTWISGVICLGAFGLRGMQMACRSRDKQSRQHPGTKF